MIRIQEKKKKPYSSKTVTTGDPDLNTAHFNKEIGKTCAAVGTFAAPSPDGASSVSTANGGEGGGMAEALTLKESKRYVRRYYIRPQEIFCSNKLEILKALVEFGDENCSIYTLNNLGDEKDVTKLTNKDIIYYYDDGILYDKNHVKVLDYDLNIKHEEKRDKVNVETTPDAELADIYDDRVTDQTDTEEVTTTEAFNPFSLTFESYNAYGEKLVEGKVTDGICCICGEKYAGYGNNPEPYMSAKNGERCCDGCNLHYVIPARLEQMNAERSQIKGKTSDED